MIQLFEDKIKDYLTVYKTPIGPNDLDPSLFIYDPYSKAPILNPAVLAQITKDLQEFSGEQPSRVKNAYIVGNALKPGNQNRTSPLKVLVILNKDIMDADVDGVLAEEILLLAKNLSGKLAVSTTRPINYSITIRDIDSFNYDGVYEVLNGRWYKIPSGVKHGESSLSK